MAIARSASQDDDLRRTRAMAQVYPCEQCGKVIETDDDCV